MKSKKTNLVKIPIRRYIKPEGTGFLESCLLIDFKERCSEHPTKVRFKLYDLEEIAIFEINDIAPFLQLKKYVDEVVEIWNKRISSIITPPKTHLSPVNGVNFG